ELAGVAERRVVHGRSNLCWRTRFVHNDLAAARRATAQVRLMILIERQIPQDHALRPMARYANNQLHLLLEHFAFLPIAAGAFSHPDFLARETLIEFCLCGGAATVAMRGDAPGESRRVRIV